MKYKEFMNAVKEEVAKQLDRNVVICPVLKNNDTVYQGLIILDPVLNVSPTIYLDPYYHRYVDGQEFEEIIKDIIKTYKENLPTEDFDISKFMDFTKAKDKIIMKLVNTDKNKELLRDVPNIPFYDLSLVFLVDVSKFMGEFATILIHNQHLQCWDVIVDDLYNFAKENTPKLLPPRLDDLHDVFEDITGEDLSFLKELDAKILTNHLRIHGATCIAYPELLKEVYEIIEGSFIIIPSSIHEVLIIPEKNISEEHSIKDFNNMILEVNTTQLTKDEVLSNHAYYFDGTELQSIN